MASSLRTSAPPGGKRPTATVHLSARHSGGSVLIGVSDDGGGIDARAVRNRAVERGLVAPDAVLSEAETFALLFEPGFSIAKADHRRQRPRRGNGCGPAKCGEPARKHRRSEQARIGHQREAAPAPHPGHHRRSVGHRGRRLFVLPLANTLECIEPRAKTSRRPMASTWPTCAGRSFPTSRCGNTSISAPSGRRSNRSCWWKPRRDVTGLLWIRRWETAKR